MSIDALPELDTLSEAVEFCSLASEDVSVQEDTFSAAVPLRSAFSAGAASRVRPGANVFFNWQEHCEIAVREYQAARANVASSVRSDRAFLAAASDARDDTVLLQSQRYFASTRAGLRGLADTGTPRRRLLARAAGGRSGSGAAKGRSFESSQDAADVREQGWNTSDVVIGSERIEDKRLPPRFVGDGNVLLGGLLMHQTRRAQEVAALCAAQHARLALPCVNDLRATINTDASASKTAPFGQDPAFNVRSVLFSADAAVNMSAYYNDTEGSREMSILGFPRGFFSLPMPSYEAGYPLIFPVCIPAYTGSSCCLMHRRCCHIEVLPMRYAQLATLQWLSNSRLWPDIHVWYMLLQSCTSACFTATVWLCPAGAARDTCT